MSKERQKGKKGDRTLIMPGSAGWEIWRGQEELALQVSQGEQLVSDLSGLPKSGLHLAFPIREVTAAPFVAATTSDEMFDDLAQMHLERSGLKLDDSAGRLNDCFVISRREEETLLLPVTLSPPEETALPARPVEHFDVSVRCLPIPPAAIVLWREFGRWVFTVSDPSGEVLYFQALPTAQFDHQMVREVVLAQVQLSMQDVVQSIETCQVWVQEGEIEPGADATQLLGEMLGLSVEVYAKPAPRFPAKFSQLLPANVRAERAARRKGQQMKLAIAAAILLYLSFVGLMAWRYLQTKKKYELAAERAEKAAPEAKKVQTFIAKWDELKPLVENDYFPLEQYLKAYEKAPKNKGLKITTVEINNSFRYDSSREEPRLNRSIFVDGDSVQLKEALDFGADLRESSYFIDFNWNIPDPVEAKNGRQSFTYEGRVAVAEN